jgi:hypothetical protein
MPPLSTNLLALIGLATASFSLVVVTALTLSPRNERRTVILLVIIGLVVAVSKIWVVQQMPQWHNIQPDSITYDLNAQAFAEHWNGNAAAGESYNLRGFLAFHTAGVHGADWMPGDKLTFASVIGSHEWLFTGYIALWYWLSEATQALAIWSNALWAAFFPAAAFGIAHSLGASRRVSLAAGGIALLDPSASVNASWLLKDSLACFLAMAALWALLIQLRDGGKVRFVLAALALGGLGGVRLVGFVALVIAAIAVSLGLLLKDKKRRTLGLTIIGVVFSAWLINGLVAQAPHVNFTGVALNINQTLATPFTPLRGGADVLRSNQGDVTTDDSVLAWKDALAENPTYAIIRSAARTLFAPYPWVAITPGLNWVSFSELYYPGVILWILCLPGIFAALVLGLRQLDPGFCLLALFLAALLAAYTIWLGEWSTRQRVFVLPAIFALAAIGWGQLHGLVRGLRTVSPLDHDSTNHPETRINK